jgi:hypothetical protein
MNYFEYLNCFPEGSKNIIQSETDSFYFKHMYYEKFKENVSKYKCPEGFKFVVAEGKELAMIKVEEDTINTSYFFGKKLYLCGSKSKLKGIPSKTITPDGTHISLLYKKIEGSKNYDLTLSRNIFEDISTGKSVKVKYSTLQKEIYGTENTLGIYSGYKTRVINAVNNVEEV